MKLLTQTRTIPGKLITDEQTIAVNQLNAQIKLTEIWKAVHLEKYPIVSEHSLGANDIISRSQAVGKLINDGVSVLLKSSFKKMELSFGITAQILLQNAIHYIQPRKKLKNMLSIYLYRVTL